MFWLVFGVGRFRSVEVDFRRPTLRSVLGRPTENDFFGKNCLLRRTLAFTLILEDGPQTTSFLVYLVREFSREKVHTLHLPTYILWNLHPHLIEKNFMKHYTAGHKYMWKRDFTRFFFVLPIWLHESSPQCGKTRNSLPRKIFFVKSI